MTKKTNWSGWTLALEGKFSELTLDKIIDVVGDGFDEESLPYSPIGHRRVAWEGLTREVAFDGVEEAVSEGSWGDDEFTAHAYQTAEPENGDERFESIVGEHA